MKFSSSVGNISKVPFIQHFGITKQLRLLFQTEIVPLVYILTLPVLKTHGHFGMLFADKCLYKSQCWCILRWIIFNSKLLLWRFFLFGFFFGWLGLFSCLLSIWKSIVKNFSIISYLTDWKICIFLIPVNISPNWRSSI